jgi:lipoprotein-releasing system permease protein
MTPSLYLALAYLRPKKHMLSVINLLAVVGTLFGVAVLIIVISVMNGFDDMWKEKILSFHPHVTVYSYGRPMAEDDPLFAEVASLPEVRSVAPFLQMGVLLMHDDAFDMPMLRGIDPQHDFLFQKLAAEPEKTLVEGSFTFGEEECLIGIDLARRLGVRTGDRISILSPSSFANARDGEIRLPSELRIAGIFKVGMWQIDQGFVLTNLQTARDVLGMDDGVHGMQIIGEDVFAADTLATRIGTMSGNRYVSMSWMQMNEHLFGALELEKRMMFFLLGVISIVASFLVSCTLIMVSVQKTREIGLLKSMGFRNGTVMRVFMWYGLIQGVFGILLGTGAGLLILHYRQTIVDAFSAWTGRQALPKDLYFLDSLPSRTDPSDVGLIVGMVLVLCLVGGALPAWIAARKNPVEALRHD